jgi:excisionase family DNA binding protein
VPYKEFWESVRWAAFTPETAEWSNHMSSSPVYSVTSPVDGASPEFERPVDVKAAARFLGISASLVYSYVERKQIPHFLMMGRAIRFRLSELEAWREQFHVNGETE